MDEKKQNKEKEIDIVEMLFYFLRHWYLFLAAVVITTAIGLSYCRFFVTPQYTSTTKILILPKELALSATSFTTQLAYDCKELIGTREVLEPAIEKCGLNMSYESLRGRVSVANITNTRVLSITVTHPSPEIAQQLANAIRETAAERIKAVTDVEAVNTATEANLPKAPSSPSRRNYAMTSAAIGFLIVLVPLAIRFLLDDSIKTEEDVERHLGLSVLAVIPLADDSGKKKKRNVLTRLFMKR